MSDIQKDTEQIILAIGREVFSAIQRKDVESLSNFLADDFVHRSADGSESGRADFLRGISEMPVDVVSIRGEHQKVNVYGEVAVLTGVQHAEWRQGDEARGLNSVAFTDVFAKRDARWLMVLAYGVDLDD